MDINALKAEVARDETRVTFTLYRKDGDPYLAADGTFVTMSVLGAESAAYRTAKKMIQRKMLQTRQRRLEPEDLDRNRVTLAASVLVDWSGIEKDGAPLPYSRENALALLEVEHILDQVEQAISGHSDFFKNSSTS